MLAMIKNLLFGGIKKITGDLSILYYIYFFQKEYKIYLIKLLLGLGDSGIIYFDMMTIYFSGWSHMF